MRGKRFTLIELLVVLTIIVLLVAMALPAYMYVRKQARIATAKVQIKQIEIALTNYQSAYNSLLPFMLQTTGSETLVNYSGSGCVRPAWKCDSGQPWLTGYGQLMITLSAMTNSYCSDSSLLNSVLNPRTARFLDVPTPKAVVANSMFTAAQLQSGAVATDQVWQFYADPWGREYRVVLDTAASDSTPAYISSSLIQGSWAIWSTGPDGLDSTTPTDPTNKDNIVNWQK